MNGRGFAMDGLVVSRGLSVGDAAVASGAWDTHGGARGSSSLRRPVVFVLNPPSDSAFWARISGDALVVDLAVEARRLLPSEFLRGVGEWEAAAAAFAPEDGDLKQFSRARDGSPEALARTPRRELADDEAARGASLIASLVASPRFSGVSTDAARRGAMVRLCAAIERRGIPVDYDALDGLTSNGTAILKVAAEKDGVLHLIGNDGRFRPEKVKDFLRSRPVPRKLTAGGELSIDRSALELAARADGSFGALLAFRQVEGVFRSFRVPVGSDGRNHARMRPFRATTGRTAPRGSILSAPSLYWAFVRPPPGRALVYVDFASEEIGIAAARSGDAALARAYASGDPYVEFASEVGRLGSFREARSVAKTAMLGLQYGMGPATLAERSGCDPRVADKIVAAHHDRFPAYWDFVRHTVRAARQDGRIASRLGWQRVLTPWPGNPSVQNFPVQSAAADILVVAALLIEDLGFDIVALNHDAVMVEVDERDAVEAARLVAWAMNVAAEDLLDGFSLRTTSETATADTPFAPSRARDERILRLHRQLVDEAAQRSCA